MRNFYMTADELREAGMRVNENITHDFRAPSVKALMIRGRRIMQRREHHVADGKFAEMEGDTLVADSCRRAVDEIDSMVAIWKKRWRTCR